MNNEDKFWFNLIGICLLALVLIVLIGLGGCYQVEQTSRIAIQNGYQMDRGDWRKR